MSGTAGRAVAAERYDLSEAAADSRIFATQVNLNVTGKVHPVPGPDRALPLKVTGEFSFDERRLPGAGRQARALRAVRYYDDARAALDAGGELSHVLLRDEVRLVVASGQIDGLELFSPAGPLKYAELELLKTPADTLAVVALLPESKVEINEAWQPAEWVLPLLAGIEAAEKSSLSCRLFSVEGSTAKIALQGETTGAISGAPAQVVVDGFVWFDLSAKHVSRIELKQTEKRSIGAVSPGLDVVAQAIVERRVRARPRRLTDEELAAANLDPNEASLLLMFAAPAWNMRFYHDRHWHLFHQSSEVAVLRLLDKGGLITQCNIRKLPDAEPGEHVSEDQFQADVRRTLGSDLQEIVQADRLKVREGLYVFRVVAVGAVETLNEKKEPISRPMQWVYYLVANSDGRQVALVFTLDPKLFDDLKSRDLAIVGGLEFLPPPARPSPALRLK
ncbi:MAG: hypothetical protein ACT4QC_22480 [Planctomycetaceae bacterium]